jgi:hypothetical protein
MIQISVVNESRILGDCGVQAIIRMFRTQWTPDLAPGLCPGIATVPTTRPGTVRRSLDR